MYYKVLPIFTDAADKLHYANDKAILNDTYNMVCTGSSSIEDKIREFAWLASFNEHMGEGYRQAYQHIISPTEKYTEPEKLIQFGRDFLDKEYPNCQATLSIHNDNERGSYHLHIIMNAVKMDFYKVNVKKKESVRKAYYLVHDLATKYGLDPATKELLEKPREDRKNKTDCGREKAGGKSIRAKLKEIINKSLWNVRSFSHFEARLNTKGVRILRCHESVKVKDEKGNYKKDKDGKIIKEVIDQIKFEYKGNCFRNHSLGEKYSKASIEKAIEKSLLHQKEVLYKKITYKINNSNLIYNVRKEFSENVKWMYEDRMHPINEIVALLYKLLTLLIIVLKTGLYMGKQAVNDSTFTNTKHGADGEKTERIVKGDELEREKKENRTKGITEEFKKEVEKINKEILEKTGLKDLSSESISEAIAGDAKRLHEKYNNEEDFVDEEEKMEVEDLKNIVKKGGQEKAKENKPRSNKNKGMGDW